MKRTLLTEVGILPFPALGRLEFYREFESLIEKVQAAQARTLQLKALMVGCHAQSLTVLFVQGACRESGQTMVVMGRPPEDALKAADSFCGTRSCSCPRFP